MKVGVKVAAPDKHLSTNITTYSPEGFKKGGGVYLLQQSVVTAICSAKYGDAPLHQ